MARLVSLILCTTLLLIPRMVDADAISFIRRMTMDRLDLEINVKNESGEPLAGAVIWYIDNPVHVESGQDLNKSIMLRMAKRYASQSAFLRVDDIPGAIFIRADLNGTYINSREIGGLHDKRSPYIIVATKFGYVPEIIEGYARLNRRHILNFSLRRDGRVEHSSHMEELDRLLAQAVSPFPSEVKTDDDKLRFRRELNRQLRQLAHRLEKDGNHDVGSAAYWALADFPELVSAKGSDGTAKIIGYQNSGKDEQSRLDRERAYQLNNSVPKLLLIKKLIERGFPSQGITEPIKGNAFLEIFEELASGVSAEQVLPKDYRVAIYQALRWSTPHRACALIQRAYAFEPTTMGVNEWWGKIDAVSMQTRRLRMQQQTCEIAGLPPRSPSR